MRAPKLLAATAMATLIIAGCGDDGGGGEDNEDAGDAVAVHASGERRRAWSSRSWRPTRPTAARRSSWWPASRPRSRARSRATSPTSPSSPNPGWPPSTTSSRSRWVAPCRSSAWPRATPRPCEGLDAFDPDSGLNTKVCSERDVARATWACWSSTTAGVTPDPDTVEEGCENEALEQVAERRPRCRPPLQRRHDACPTAPSSSRSRATQIFDFNIVYTVQGDSDATTASSTSSDRPRPRPSWTRRGTGSEVPSQGLTAHEPAEGGDGRVQRPDRHHRDAPVGHVDDHPRPARLRAAPHRRPAPPS